MLVVFGTFLWGQARAKWEAEGIVEPDADCDNDVIDADEDVGLTTSVELVDQASVAFRDRVALLLLFLQLFTSLFLVMAAARSELHIFGYLAVVFGCLTSTYIVIVWSFDIPLFSCHGAVAARERLPSPYQTVHACVRAGTNSAPLSFMCCLMTMHTVVGSLAFSVMTSYIFYAHLRNWWGPYLCGLIPPTDVLRYISASAGRVTRLPAIGMTHVRPDVEHALLMVLVTLLMYFGWGQLLMAAASGDAGDEQTSIASQLTGGQSVPVGAPTGGGMQWVLGR